MCKLWALLKFCWPLSFVIFHISLTTLFRRSPRLQLENSARYIVVLHVDVVRSNACQPSLRWPRLLPSPILPLGYKSSPVHMKWSKSGYESSTHSGQYMWCICGMKQHALVNCSDDTRIMSVLLKIFCSCIVAEQSVKPWIAVVLAGEHVGAAALCEARSRHWHQQHGSTEPSCWHYTHGIQTAYHMSSGWAWTHHACVSESRLWLVFSVIQWWVFVWI